MPNQFTKALAEGREPPKSQNAYTLGKRDKMDPQQKAKIRAAFAANKLEDFINGEIELSQAQVSAARALLDKGMPSLQAVEEKQINDFDAMGVDELETMIGALITRHPELIARLNLAPKLVDAGQTDQSGVVDEQQTANAA